MFIRVKTNPSQTGFVVQKSTYAPKLHLDRDFTTRTLSKVGSESYKRSLRRAFNRAKLLAFFNPDLTQFITLTYKNNIQDPQIVLEHVKQMINTHNKNPKTKPLKYIYVLELQKRGAIHIHMVANEVLELQKNRNNYWSVKAWKHGYSSVLTIRDFDNNFRPYLYLFKYMHKAQRVGKSFIHTSRNFDKITDIDYGRNIEKIMEGEILLTESTTFTINEKTQHITKDYIRPTI